MKRLCPCPRLLASALLASIVVSARLETTASAAPIVWGSPQNISGDSDVSTTGTLLYAYNFGSLSVASTTVNGVTFSAFPLPDSTGPGTPVTVDSVSISESPGFLYGNNSFSSGSAPFVNLSTAYKNLLGSGATAGEPGTITLQLGGLAPGQTYQFQWWSNNSTSFDNWSQTIATASNSVALITNLSGTGSEGTGVEGGIGQYAIGTFTADASSSSIAFTGDPSTSYWPLINGFQVRAIPVPEPRTWCPALAGLACGGCAVWRRRKRA